MVDVVGWLKAYVYKLKLPATRVGLEALYGKASFNQIANGNTALSGKAFYRLLKYLRIDKHPGLLRSFLLAFLCYKLPGVGIELVRKAGLELDEDLPEHWPKDCPQGPAAGDDVLPWQDRTCIADKDDDEFGRVAVVVERRKRVYQWALQQPGWFAADEAASDLKLPRAIVDIDLRALQQRGMVESKVSFGSRKDSALYRWHTTRLRAWRVTDTAKGKGKAKTRGKG